MVAAEQLGICLLQQQDPKLVPPVFGKNRAVLEMTRNIVVKSHLLEDSVVAQVDSVEA